MSTKTITVLPSPVPADCPLQIKNVKIARALSEETLAYTATLYWQGKRVGTASNHGHGGSDLYHFERDEDAVCEYAKRTVGDLELLVGNMLDERDLQADARRMIKRGAKVVLLVCRDHYEYPTHNGEGDPITGYGVQMIVGLLADTPEALDEALATNDAEAYRVVAKAVV